MMVRKTIADFALVVNFMDQSGNARRLAAEPPTEPHFGRSNLFFQHTGSSSLQPPTLITVMVSLLCCVLEEQDHLAETNSYCDKDLAEATDSIYIQEISHRRRLHNPLHYQFMLIMKAGLVCISSCKTIEFFLQTVTGRAARLRIGYERSGDQHFRASSIRI